MILPGNYQLKCVHETLQPSYHPTRRSDSLLHAVTSSFVSVSRPQKAAPSRTPLQNEMKPAIFFSAQRIEATEREGSSGQPTSASAAFAAPLILCRVIRGTLYHTQLSIKVRSEVVWASVTTHATFDRVFCTFLRQ